MTTKAMKRSTAPLWRRVGYDFDLGSMVVGAEAEYSDSTGKQDFNETIDVPITGRIATGRDLYVGGRIGFPITPATLVYGKLGLHQHCD
jgi:outer membrane immunogenic protein